jgi:hypothetical protein
MDRKESFAKVQEWLKNQDIRFIVYDDGVLGVSRDAMVQSRKGVWESQYDDIISDINKLGLGGHFFWSGKDDNYLYLDRY